MDGSIVALLQIVRAERGQPVEPVEAEHVTGLMFWRVNFPFLKDSFSWKHLKLWACLCRRWYCPKWSVRLTQWLQDSVPWIEWYHFIHRHSDNDKARYDNRKVFRSPNNTKNATVRTMCKCSFRGIARRRKLLGIALKQLELQVSVSHFVLTTPSTTRSFFSLPSSKSQDAYYFHTLFEWSTKSFWANPSRTQALMAFARASKVIKQLKKKQSKGEAILEDKINRMALRNKDLVGDTWFTKQRSVVFHWWCSG